jgi:LmbE family N-acetylglucosaminyl deacetylase
MKELDRAYTCSTIHCFSTLLKVKNVISRTETVNRPSFGKHVIVLSPHFDDDVIGCGGTLALHRKAGGEARIVYITDGREGDPECDDPSKVEKARKREARNALEILGFDEPDSYVFMDLPETRLAVNEKNARRLWREISDYYRTPPWPPLMIPSFLDNHRDHLAVNLILKRLCPAFPPDAIVYAYEVWTPSVANCLVDITDVAALKEKALTCYESQLKYVNYRKVAMALNSYRTAITLQGEGYAEAFLRLPVREYCGLYR